MKRFVTAVVVMAMVIIGTVAVSAAETDNGFVSNMDAATFIETRTAQIDAADITEAEKAELLTHVNEVAANGLFGNGPQNGEKGDGNAVCVLGDKDLGIFRSPSAGRRTGEGNGVGSRLQDGSGAGAGFRSQGSSNDCIIDN